MGGPKPIIHEGTPRAMTVGTILKVVKSVVVRGEIMAGSDAVAVGDDDDD